MEEASVTVKFYDTNKRTEKTTCYDFMKIGMGEMLRCLG